MDGFLEPLRSLAQIPAGFDHKAHEVGCVMFQSPWFLCGYPCRAAVRYGMRPLGGLLPRIAPGRFGSRPRVLMHQSGSLSGC